MTMTYDDSMRVLDRLKGGWSKRLSDDTFAIWLDELEPLDFSPAYAAARQLIRTSKYFPAISEFLASYTQHERDQRPHAEPTPACDHCDGGYTIVDPIANTVLPCSRCRYDVWKQHQAGWPDPTRRDTTEPELLLPPEVVADRLAAMKALLP